MNSDERLTIAFESIARSLKGLHEQAQRAGTKFWPEPRQPREAVITRVQTEEDILREKQGQTNQTLEEWLRLPEDETEFIGEREREFLEEQKRNAGAKAAEASGQDSGGTETPQGEAGTGSVGSGPDSVS